MLRTTLIASIALLFGAAAASAQMKGTSKGNYATMQPALDTMKTADGTMLIGGHYTQVTFANDATSPLNNTKDKCNSLMVVGKDGKTVSYSGSCFGLDAAGNGESFWWRQTEAASATCPSFCGVWGFFSGSGKFANITGGGTWKAAAAFADGTGMGTWEGSYETK